MRLRYVRINVLLPKYPLHDVARITVTHCGMCFPEVLKSLFCIAEKPVSRHGRASFAVRNDVFYDMKNSKRLYARVLYKMQNTRVFEPDVCRRANTRVLLRCRWMISLQMCHVFRVRTLHKPCHCTSDDTGLRSPL